MSEPKHRRAKALFEAALDLPREERAAFLKDACGPDRTLEAEVRSLVAAHEEAEGFLEGGQVARALLELPAGDADPLVGAVIGDYRVLGLLARGGMGAVYRAEQEHPRREVALKLIDRRVTTPALLRRFDVEAQLLARLQHAGIAQIHVAGATGPEHGRRPYFAMELVDGLPLTTFADQQALGVPARLELLIKICEAVQHAHQVGVIHRDLKPANILVTSGGQPKILDFGIARSTDTDLQVTTMEGDQVALLGTLPYMSPEQVRGNPDELDTRSDVHALGILAYELLTGRLPRDLEGKPLTDAIRAIVDEEPRTLAAAGRGRFPADLETIVAKALESDRHRRYDSASELAADLRRFLDGQPISARPQSTVYQIKKLVNRNRLPAALLAGLVLVAIGSAILMGFQIRRTAGERDRASVAAGTANEVAIFLESLFLEADPEQARGRTLTARQLLDRGAERIETELREQPAVRGRLLGLLGKVYGSLDLSERAVPLLEAAVEVGRTLRREEGGRIDSSNLQMALTQLARYRAAQGRNDEAIVLCREAVEVSAATDGTDNVYYATCLNHLAYHLALEGTFEEARTLVLQGLAMRERFLGPDHVDVGWSVYQYAWLLRSMGETEAARAQFARACAIWEEGFPENHPQTAACLLDYAHVLADLGEFAEALPHAERALATQLTTLGREHSALADTLDFVGYLHRRTGNLPAALRHFTEAVEIHQRTAGPAGLPVLTALFVIASVHGEMGDAAGEEEVLQSVLDLVWTHHPDSPELIGEALGRLGAFYGREGRGEEAKDVLRESVVSFEGAGEEFARDLETTRILLGNTLTAAADAEEALLLQQQILGARLEHPEWDEPDPLFVRWRIGLLLLRRGRSEEAEADLRELLPLAEAANDVNACFPWNIRWMLGHCCHLAGRADEARALYDEVLGFAPEPPPNDVFWLLLRKAEHHAAAGRMEEARRELAAARAQGLDRDDGELALRLNPHLAPEARGALLEELGRR